MLSQVSQESNPTIVVAVNKDKHSTFAVRWAIENLVVPGRELILVHVETRHHGNGGGGVADGGLVDDIFTQYRAYCARKGTIVHKEVVLEGNDVPATLLDYINKHHVTNIVLGASSKNPLSRFWTHDVPIPTMINKAASDFCSVYVIAKGKAQSVRPAARQESCSTFPKLLSSQTQAKYNPQHEMTQNRSFSSSIGDNPTIPSSRSRNLASFNFNALLAEPATDLDQSTDITRVEISEGNSLPSGEVHRLKEEVKQIMNMYNKACKDAVSAQKRVDELKQLKLDEKSKSEQARLAEEAALALVEMEKAKCRAAIEAAEKAQKIAEKDTQRRKQAEMKAKRELDEKNRALHVLSNNDVRYRKYATDEIEEATDKFSSSMKIGEGGYGPVFRGKLDHTPVAIKLLRAEASQGMEQFQQEVEVLSCIRHPNMILLMGACPEYGCLVYEFMDNGSLEDRLFCKGDTPPIPWHIRFKIAADIATGLLFLHRAKPEPIVHRDLKPANILLDHHYTCKISDVGLARLVPPPVADIVTQYHMTSAAGTFCYIDPEYQQTGKLGTKSDVYSLGVVLLQIITARPPMALTHHVERAIETGTFADLLDPAVPDWPVEEALSYAKMALKCAELRKKDRPDLDKEILPELNRLKELGMKHGLGQCHSFFIPQDAALGHESIVTSKAGFTEEYGVVQRDKDLQV